jgi:hypothetical protein
MKRRNVLIILNGLGFTILIYVACCSFRASVQSSIHRINPTTQSSNEN